MKIIADENIPFVKGFFQSFGEVQTLNGRALGSDDVQNADVLLVRSVTQVNQALLSKNKKIKFVGSATIGCDHIDLDYLQEKNIQFVNAPGSNANSVAEYVLSALLVLSERYQFDLRDKTLGIIGYGHVGSRVKQLMDVLGVKCLINDPPLQALNKYPDVDFVTLDEVMQADILTLHVPLMKTGRYPTYHLVNKVFLKQLKPGVILINTARGSVIDNSALKNHLKNNHCSVVLDVWENEPVIDLELLDLVDIGSSHIAGYSYDGKLKGVQMLYKAFCEFFNLKDDYQFDLPETDKLLMDEGNDEFMSALKSVVWSCYDIRHDDQLLRELGASADIGRCFDQLRKNYRVRREFCAHSLTINKFLPRSFFEGLGFLLADEK